VRDILENITDPTKLVILQDGITSTLSQMVTYQDFLIYAVILKGMSPVHSCDDMAAEFIEFASEKGVRLSTCSEVAVRPGSARK
jgi:hypothetical protein